MESKDLIISSIKNKGIFEIISQNYCILDIDLNNGIMAITFSGKKDRLFIFPIKKLKANVEKIRGKNLINFDVPTKELIPSPIVYAYRGWTGYSDEECPYIIEPSSRYITEFSLKHEGKMENSTIFSILVQFFNLPSWK